MRSLPGVFAVALLAAACTSTDPSGPHAITGAFTVSAGGLSTCALGSGGGVSCWGAVPPGAATDTNTGTPISRKATAVPMPEPIVALGLGKNGFFGNGCVVGESQQVYCWGEFVVDIDAGVSFPDGITALSGATLAATVSFGEDHLCVTRTDHAVRCYGSFSGGGRGTDSISVANDSIPSVNLTPNGLSPTLDALGTAQGTNFGCAIRTDSLAACWGLKLRGQIGGALGDSLQHCGGSSPDWCQPGPALVAGGHTYTQIAAAFDHACAVRADGTVDCWGRKPGTPIGNWLYSGCGTPSDCLMTPTTVPLPGIAIRVTLGTDHACALLTSGAVYCWGDNTFGQLGRPGASSLTPVAVAGGFSFATISAGANHTCAVELGTGLVGCWGANDYGQLGDGTLTNRDHPVPVLVR